MKWRCYYGDGTTFSDHLGSPSDAPAWNLQAVAQTADIAIGRTVIAGKDFYWHEDGEWFGGDYIGLIDYLQRSGLVKFGRLLNRLQFEAILNQAVTDPDLPAKTATGARGE